MKDLGIVRRFFYRDSVSISKIERRTGLTRQTVSKCLSQRVVFLTARGVMAQMITCRFD